MRQVIFLPEAEQEMIEAALYYQSQASGLGVDFLAEVERALKFIVASPTTYPIIEGELRRRILKRFPFGVLYRFDPVEIVITAVAHLRRRPGYWKKRIKKRQP